MPELLELLSVAMASKIFRRRPRARCGRTAEGSCTERNEKNTTALHGWNLPREWQTHSPV